MIHGIIWFRSLHGGRLIPQLAAGAAESRTEDGENFEVVLKEEDEERGDGEQAAENRSGLKW